MRFVKTFLFSCIIFFQFIFASCMLENNTTTGQIKINLPSPSRSASAPSNVASYKIRLMPFPEEYSEVASYYISGNNIDNPTEEKENLLRELDDYVQTHLDNLLITEKIYNASSYTKTLEPGGWFIILTALDFNDEEIYEGTNHFILEKGQNVQVPIKMKKVTRTREDYYYTGEPSNTFSCYLNAYFDVKDAYNNQISGCNEAIYLNKYDPFYTGTSNFVYSEFIIPLNEEYTVEYDRDLFQRIFNTTEIEQAYNNVQSKINTTSANFSDFKTFYTANPPSNTHSNISNVKYLIASQVPNVNTINSSEAQFNFISGYTEIPADFPKEYFTVVKYRFSNGTYYNCFAFAYPPMN